MIKKIRALGLMSGTSLDGVDVAVITTDGFDVYDFGPALTVPYEDTLREKIRAILGKKPETPEVSTQIREVEVELTEFHASVVKEFMTDYDENIDVIGFHGHTIHHEPQNHYTHQIGDGQMLADLTGIKVVNRFRNADVAAGGEGAPLVPVYHNALCGKFERPIAIVNIGGVSNITWLGRQGEMLAFDTGPGNAPINDWVLKHAGQHMDYNGKLAITGKIDGKVLASLMRHKYLAIYPPKSIDRNIFNEKLEHLEALSVEDGAATATAFTAEAIAYSCVMYLPEMPKSIIVCGGGARNPTLIRFLRQRLDRVDIKIAGENTYSRSMYLPKETQSSDAEKNNPLVERFRNHDVDKVEIKTASEVDWNCDALEAQAFAFLAVRRLYNLPISFPTTTRVPEPMLGGEIHTPTHSL